MRAVVSGRVAYHVLTAEAAAGGGVGGVVGVRRDAAELGRRARAVRGRQHKPRGACQGGAGRVNRQQEGGRGGEFELWEWPRTFGRREELTLVEDDG